jgi:epoxyqueuosine reductase
MQRAKRRGLLRNVAVALGNWGDPAAVPFLAEALSDVEPTVRGHVAWALGRIRGDGARRALVEALAAERVAWVQGEILQAID